MPSLSRSSLESPISVIRYSSKRWVNQNLLWGAPLAVAYVYFFELQQHAFWTSPAGLALVLGTLWVAWLFKSRKLSKLKLALLEDRLELWDETRTPTGCIPFSNVEAFRIYSDNPKIFSAFDAHVGVQLVDKSRGDTYWPGNALFLGPRFIKGGCDLVLGEHFELPTAKVVDILNLHHRCWREGIPVPR